MKTVGIGVDIEAIARFRNLPFNKNRAFYNRIFTQAELDYCLKKNDPYPHLAARFCAKEALIKALNNRISDPKSIEVKLEDNAPKIALTGYRVWVSMAHDSDKAIAFVTVEK